MGKRDVKPFVEPSTKDFIEKLSFLTGYSVKSIGEDLCKHAIENGVSEELSQYFRRGLVIGDTVYEGHENPKKFAERGKKKVERISLVVEEWIYEYAYSLSFAIGCSLAKVVAYFIERSVKDSPFITQYTSQYLASKMDESHKALLQDIISDINNNYLEGEHSVAALLMCIADEIKQPHESFDTAIEKIVSGWS